MILMATAEPLGFALVTGASYGVGAATAVALAKTGLHIAITATRKENLSETLATLRSAGTTAIPVALDLLSNESIESAVDEIEREFGVVDILVNNAAVNLRRAAVDVDIHEWNRVIQTNLTGTFFLTQRIGRRLIEKKQPGRIVNITSTHAFVGAAERSTYGISKAALSHMTKMLAVEWAPHQILVNAVAPGRMATNSPTRRATGNDEQYMSAMINRIPLRRLVTAGEVAEAVNFLVGPGGAFMTGHTIMIDGGLTSQ
jgi:NAD(P)-dependent dehydrogenase (short-subunit alcohol dehydrogenase family)